MAKKAAKKETTFAAATTAIQKAFRAGRRRIEIDGAVFRMERKDRKVEFISGGERQKRTEKWIVVTPISGAHVPVYNVELTETCNLRSKMV